MSEVTVEQEVSQIQMRRPHVVIVGAGASRAAFPKGERNGRRLPLMADFCDIVPVESVLKGTDIDYTKQDFEGV